MIRVIKSNKFKLMSQTNLCANFNRDELKMEKDNF